MQIGTYVEKMFKSELSGNIIGKNNATLMCCFVVVVVFELDVR